MSDSLLDGLLAEIEADKGWRTEELIFFENQLANHNKNDTDQKKISKALILFLYATFEGHVKFIFECYLSKINQLKLTCQDVITPLMASNLNKTFEEFKNTQRKPKFNKIFKEEHPKNFVELGRRIEFIDNYEKIMSSTINLNINKIVDTESNLTKKVLSKILFRVGFDNQADLQNIESLDKLLELRNAISHGAKQEGLSYKEYLDIKQEIFDLMRTIQHNIIDSFSQEEYLKVTK